MATAPDMRCDCCARWHLAMQLLMDDRTKLQQALLGSERRIADLLALCHEQAELLDALAARPIPPPLPSPTNPKETKS